MKYGNWGVILLCVSLYGCATPNVPRGAKLVGGGLMIDYQVPSDGTAILIEKRSGRIIVTESLTEGNSFNFGPGHPYFGEVLHSLFGETNAVYDGEYRPISTNAFFQLYFVPR